MTDLDKKLQEIATKDWPQFVALIGSDAVLDAKICLLRQNNSSYGEISQRLKISREKARYNCGKCEIDIVPSEGFAVRTINNNGQQKN